MACWHQKNLRFFVLLKHRKSYKMPLFFFCEILGLWNTTGYGANWFKLGICWLDSSVFTRKADLSAIHFLNTSLQFVKRCCIIVKKWQGSKIHVVNLLKFHQRTKNSCIQLFQCLPLHVYVKDSSLQPFCRLGRLELSQFAGTCQGSQWNGGWTHAKDRATLHLKHPKAAEDPSDATTQARFHRLNRLMPPLLWTRRIVGSWDRGWLAGRHETRGEGGKNSACIAWGSIFAPKHRGAWSGSCRRVQWPLPMMACWRGKPLESSRPAWNIRSDKIKSYGWRMVEDFFSVFFLQFWLEGCNPIIQHFIGFAVGMAHHLLLQWSNYAADAVSRRSFLMGVGVLMTG